MAYNCRISVDCAANQMYTNTQTVFSGCQNKCSGEKKT